MFSVYVLQHTETKQFYIGRTNDLRRRLKEHNALQQKATKRNSGGWILIYAEAYRSNDGAVKLELRLKQHGRSKQELLRRAESSQINWNQKVVLGAAKDSLATVYQKHSSLRTRKRMYRGWRLTNAGRLSTVGVVHHFSDSDIGQRIYAHVSRIDRRNGARCWTVYAPVNVGRNYESL